MPWHACSLEAGGLLTLGVGKYLLEIFGLQILVFLGGTKWNDLEKQAFMCFCKQKPMSDTSYHLLFSLPGALGVRCFR